MREILRDVMLGLGVIFAGLSAYFQWRVPLPADLHIVQTATEHPLAGLIVVAAMFIIAGLLNSAPLLSRYLPKERKVERLDTPSADRIHICTEEVIVCGDHASITFTVFSPKKLETKFCRAKSSVMGASVMGAEFSIESSEPINIPAFIETAVKLERSLTSDEIARYGESNKRHVLIEGIAKFQGDIERNFSAIAIEANLGRLPRDPYADMGLSEYRERRTRGQE